MDMRVLYKVTELCVNGVSGATASELVSFQRPLTQSESDRFQRHLDAVMQATSLRDDTTTTDRIEKALDRFREETGLVGIIDTPVVEYEFQF